MLPKETMHRRILDPPACWKQTIKVIWRKLWLVQEDVYQIGGQVSAEVPPMPPKGVHPKMLEPPACWKRRIKVPWRRVLLVQEDVYQIEGEVSAGVHPVHPVLPGEAHPKVLAPPTCWKPTIRTEKVTWIRVLAVPPTACRKIPVAVDAFRPGTVSRLIALEAHPKVPNLVGAH